MFIDTHAHIYSSTYENVDQIVEKIKSSNINKVVNCAENLETTIEVIELSKKYKDFLYPTAGIHPENVGENFEKDVESLENLIKSNKIIAVGEIGLDYYYTKEKVLIQKKYFEAQLLLAEKYSLPVIIHSREATKDTIDILKKYNLKGIIHCFNGSSETAKEYIKMGYLLGVNGIVTFKNAKNIVEVIKEVGIEYFVLETDCPYLTPEPYRKNKNDSSYIPVIAKTLEEITGKPIDQISLITNENASHIFDFE